MASFERKVLGSLMNSQNAEISKVKTEVVSSPFCWAVLRPLLGEDIRLKKTRAGTQTRLSMKALHYVIQKVIKWSRTYARIGMNQWTHQKKPSQIGHMASCQHVAWAQALITWVRCALKSTALPTLQLWILEHPNGAVAKNIAVHILRTWLKIPSHLESQVL